MERAFILSQAQLLIAMTISEVSSTPRQFVYRICQIANYLLMWLDRECKMLPPVKFIAANNFIMGMTAGAVCGAIAVCSLSNPARLNRLNK